ncbi:hypothetical protein E6R18_22995 [Streptomyces sp. A1277]|nr:hypothetical protein E6R18_22995 [Streptomyces sp. A1277]
MAEAIRMAELLEAGLPSGGRAAAELVARAGRLLFRMGLPPRNPLLPGRRPRVRSARAGRRSPDPLARPLRPPALGRPGAPYRLRHGARLGPRPPPGGTGAADGRPGPARVAGGARPGRG